MKVIVCSVECGIFFYSPLFDSECWEMHSVSYGSKEALLSCLQEVVQQGVLQEQTNTLTHVKNILYLSKYTRQIFFFNYNTQMRIFFQQYSPVMFVMTYIYKTSSCYACYVKCSHKISRCFNIRTITENWGNVMNNQFESEYLWYLH